MGRLYEGKIIYDKTYGSVAYGCANCCAYRSPTIITDPLGIPLLGLSPNGVEAADTCGGEVNISSYFWNNWTTANHGIATVDARGNHTGVAVGSTTSSTYGVIASYAPRSCPVVQQGPAPGGDNVQKPTSAKIIDNVKQTYSNQTWTSCDGKQSKPNRYGYQRCVTYQVLDQNSNNIDATLAIHEDMAVIDTNYSSDSSTGDSSTNSAGQFLDDLALLGTTALPSNACSILKQTFTATGNSSAIRVNCIRYNSTDVTITDVTSNPTSCSKPTYHCN